MSNVTNLSDFLQDAELSTDNYNSLQIKWAELTLNTNINFNAGNSKNDLGLPEDKRHYIIDTYNWSFTDSVVTGNNYIE